VDWKIDPYPIPTNVLDVDNYFKHPLYYCKLTFKTVMQENVSGTNPDPVPNLIHRRTYGGQVLSLSDRGLMWDNLRKPLAAGGFPPFLEDLTPSPALLESMLSKRNRVGVNVAQDDKVNAHKLLPHIEHEMIWPKVISGAIPEIAIRAAIGKTNDREMRFRIGGRYPAETMLFVGANITETMLSNGALASEIIYKFAIRQVKARDQQAPGGWNHFFRCNLPEQLLLTRDSLILGASIQVPFEDYSTGTFNYSGYASQASATFNSTPYVDVPYDCTNLPGFYRLELSPGAYSNPCIEEYLTVGGSLESIALKTGYEESLAIFEQYDFRNLFKPDVPTSSP
jgi:hypothetical protein